MYRAGSSNLDFLVGGQDKSLELYTMQELLIHCAPNYHRLEDELSVKDPNKLQKAAVYILKFFCFRCFSDEFWGNQGDGEQRVE